MKTSLKQNRSWAVAVGLAATLPVSLIAQTASTASSTPAASAGGAAASPAKEEAIVLSPFLVNAEEDVGYQALSTLSGSRFNTKLKDTAASISVMTEEFLSDLAAFDISEALEFGNNLQLDHDDGVDSGAAPAGNPTIELPQRYRVRGLKTTVARNGFAWEIGADSYNVERVEDARGPNSILFGVGSAGGIINVTTKRAKLNRTATSMQFGAGSWDTWRAALDHNHVVVPKKFAVRVAALWSETGTFRYFTFNNSRRLHLTSVLQAARNTQVRAEYEYNKIEQNVPREAVLMDFSTTWIDAGRPTFSLTAAATQWSALGGSRLTANNPRFMSDTGQVMEMGARTGQNGQILTLSSGRQGNPVLHPGLYSFRINTGGPEQDRANTSWSTSAYLEHRFGKKTFLELAFNHQEYDWRSWDPQYSNRLYIDPNQTLPGTLGANPNAGRLFLETYWRIFDRAEAFDTMRGTFTTEIDFGRFGVHRLGLMGEYIGHDYAGTSRWEVYEGRPFHTNPEQNINKVIRRHYVTEGDWKDYRVYGPRGSGLLNSVTDVVTGRTFSSHWVASDDQHDDQIQKTGLVTAQSSFLKGRLMIGAGYRRDEVYTIDRTTKRDPATNEVVADWDNATTNRYTVDGQTRSFGAVAHLTPKLSLLYNRASNIGLPDIRIRVLPDARNAPPTEGRGEDYGIGLDLFDGRLYARVTRYTTTEANGAVFTLAGGDGATGTSNAVLDALVSHNLIPPQEYNAHEITRVSGSTRSAASEGYEFQLTGRLTKSLSLSTNFSITESTTADVAPEVVAWWAQEKPFWERFPQNTPTTGTGTIASEIAEFETTLGQAKAQEGVGRLGNRKYKANIVGRYSFLSGRLKGAYLGGSYRWQGPMLIFINPTTYQQQFSNPFGEAGLFAGFSVPVGGKRTMRVQLNINNLLNETDYVVLRRLVNNDVRAILVRAPRSWRITANLAF